MQSGLRWSGFVSRLHSLIRFASDVQPPAALVLCWRSGISQALRAWLWPAASSCILCLPPPTPGLACFAALPARSARPPPVGAPSEPRTDTPPDGGGLLVLRVDWLLVNNALHIRWLPMQFLRRLKIMGILRNRFTAPASCSKSPACAPYPAS